MTRKAKKLIVQQAGVWAYLRTRDGCVGATLVCVPPPLFLDMPLDVAQLPENAVGRASPSITYRRYLLTSQWEPDCPTATYDEQTAGRPPVLDDLKPRPPLTAKKRLQLIGYFQEALGWDIEDKSDREYWREHMRALKTKIRRVHRRK